MIPSVYAQVYGWLSCAGSVPLSIHQHLMLQVSSQINQGFLTDQGQPRQQLSRQHTVSHQDFNRVPAVYEAARAGPACCLCKIHESFDSQSRGDRSASHQGMQRAWLGHSSGLLHCRRRLPARSGMCLITLSSVSTSCSDHYHVRLALGNQ